MRICTIILFLLGSGLSASAQLVVSDTVSQSMPELSGLFTSEQIGIKSQWDVKDADNEYQLFFTSLFVFYKEFLSSQDNSRCNFHPSCSVYAIHSIQKKGAIIGVLSAFDRLLRCNGFNRKDYNINPKNRLLDDPVF